ncbi:transposase [Shewanella sp. 202IG2-18]|uniref:IS66 family transposase zinc-finger binding domain-containing protein n=1 Tax=Parashewanella hymeniacidonis TaxID=2807618 RepID=UPI00195FF842|nr:transposase [Parashewanella hymeniacidonis]
MKTRVQTLPNDIALLQQLLLEQQALLEAKDTELEAKDGKIAKLLESYQCLLKQFRLAQNKQFGRSSETHPDQGELFNEAEASVDNPDEDNSDDSETDPSTNSGKKRQPKRQPLPKNLPRKQEIHDIDDDEKQCECCGHQLVKMGQDISEKLEFIPAIVRVIEHVRLKYSCQHCEKQGTQSNIKQAPVPSCPIPKGYATPSLLSQIITSKYQYALPLYR